MLFRSARVVKVSIARRTPDPAEVRERIDSQIEERYQEMERKVRQLEQKFPGSKATLERTFMDGRDDRNTHRTAPAPLPVEISLRLQVPWGFGWLTADASGTIISSGQRITGPPTDVESLSRPYWRRAAGLDR